MLTLEWRKPALERHAHVSEELLAALGKVTKAASDLALYLFRHCIAGKFEEIDLYNLPLGEGRKSKTHEGKRYSQTTLRGALKTLEDEGLVIVRRRYPGGFFSLTVKHPGKTRAFLETQKPPVNPVENKHTPEKTPVKSLQADSRKQPDKAARVPPLTKDVRDKAIQVAFEKVNEELKTYNQTQEPYQPQKTVQSASKKKENPGKTAQTDTANDAISLPITEIYRETAEQTEQASVKNVVQNTKRSPVESNTPAVQKMAADNWHEFAHRQEHQTATEPSERDLSAHEAQDICCEIRQIMPLTAELKNEALKHDLNEIKAALKLYAEKSSQVTNPQRWLTQCIRQKWAIQGRRDTFDELRIPELTKWYAWASKAGIVDGRPLAHCPRSHPHSTSAEFLQVALMIPPYEQKLGFPSFELIRWQDAIARFPIVS